MMKRLSALVIALVLVATAAFAKNVTYTACSKDSKVIELGVVFVEGVTAKIEQEVGAAWKATAKQYDAADEASQESFNTFKANLSQEDFESLVGFTEAPTTIDGSCTP